MAVWPLRLSAQYEDLIAKRRRKHERQNESNKQSVAKKRLAQKNRMEELERRIMDGGVSDAERAEYENLMAITQRQRESWAKAKRQRYEEDKIRIIELESRIKDNVASEAEQAEYRSLIARRRENKKVKTEGDTAATETGSDRAGSQSNSGQQSSSKLLLQKFTPMLDSLGKLWQKFSQVRNSPWNGRASSVPGAARPVPVRFGVVPYH